MEPETEQPRMFSRGARVALAAFSALFGLMLLLWASDQQEIWNYAPSMFCFAIFGAIVLPSPLEKLCGYAISFVVLTACLLVILDGAENWTWRYAFDAAHIYLTFGAPALAFLIRDKLPFEFGSEGKPANHEDENE